MKYLKRFKQSVSEKFLGKGRLKDKIQTSATATHFNCSEVEWSAKNGMSGLSLGQGASLIVSILYQIHVIVAQSLNLKVSLL